MREVVTSEKENTNFSSLQRRSVLEESEEKERKKDTALLQDLFTFQFVSRVASCQTAVGQMLIYCGIGIKAFIS